MGASELSRGKPPNALRAKGVEKGGGGGGGDDDDDDDDDAHCHNVK